jgi:hypothetical protein
MPGALLPLLLIASRAAQPDASAQPLRGNPIDWNSLPDLPYRQPPQVTAQMNAYVKTWARAHRCKVQRRVADKSPAIRIQVAVLVHPQDGVRTSVPRAAGCPAVEQYAAGLVTSFARNNLAARTSAAEQWYRAAVTFVWTR